MAGIQAGDVVVSFDGLPVARMPDLMVALRAYSPGDEVTVEVSTPRRVPGDAHGHAGGAPRRCGSAASAAAQPAAAARTAPTTAAAMPAPAA